VSKESEQVLVQNRISSSSGVEEHSFEVTIHKKHGNRSSKYGKRKKKKECGNEYSSHEKGHLVKAHTKGTHVQNRNDEVDRSKDRRDTG